MFSSVFRVPSIYEEKFTNRLSVRTSAYPVSHHFANHTHTLFDGVLFDSFSKVESFLVFFVDSDLDLFFPGGGFKRLWTECSHCTVDD